MQTFGQAYAISVKADKLSFDPSKKQLVQIEIMVVDKSGIPVANADNEVMITIDGPAELIGMESGSSISHENYKSDKRKLFNGKLMAYVQSRQQAGTIKVNITAPGLKGKTVVLKPKS